jgi:hypothetical protein
MAGAADVDDVEDGAEVGIEDPVAEADKSVHPITCQRSLLS